MSKPLVNWVQRVSVAKLIACLAEVSYTAERLLLQAKLYISPLTFIIKQYS